MLNFSSIIFAPPDTRNVLCARNDGLCEALLGGRNEKGLPLLISMTTMLLLF
jgi:hypothetical protein